jgi:DNA end-binding protein Ku
VPYDEIVKGYEYGEGDYIVLTEEDFARADVRRTKTIDIEGFVEEAEIDVRYFEKPYYLEPQKGAAHAYALLREALEQSGKVGIGRFVMRNRENLAVLKPVGPVITLTQIRFPAELRSPAQLDLPEEGRAKGRELEMALSLIDQLSQPFQPETYHDTYTEELKTVIAEKAKGRKPRTKGEAPAATKVQDLMEALRASLARAGTSAPSGKAGHAPDRVPAKAKVR